MLLFKKAMKGLILADFNRESLVGEKDIETKSVILSVLLKLVDRNVNQR